MDALSWAVAVLLAVFTARRYLFLGASLLPDRPHRPSREFRIAILGAFKNEEDALPALLDALAGLDYPAERLSFTFVSDGSRDRTPARLHAWAAAHPNARVLVLAESRGKACALNVALEAAPPSDLVAVFDADTHPSAGQLAALAGAFDEPRVAVASGLVLPANPADSVCSFYAALETWVYQTVILAGKDRCRLNPPAVGNNCAYRRAELQAAGGFPPGSFSEDIELSLALGRRGLRSRWIREAKSHARVPVTIAGFWRQRTRWTSGLYSAGRRGRGLEAWLTAAGYFDRLALAGAVSLAATGRMDWWWAGAYFSAPACAVLTALWRSRNGGGRWIHLAGAPLMFGVDAAVSLWATVAHVARRRVEWRTGRAGT
jgi:cellulose synthase/poly-beta-1,6-N-acetylglucosamine synthase-like glycosyltransferase